jgi:hypothetical protein
MSERSEVPILLPGHAPEQPPTSGCSETRAQARFAFTAAIEVYELRSQTRVTGRCSDLSAGGCYVDTLSPFAVGAVVRVRMEHDKREFETGAIVAYAHVSMGMGLAFTEMKREYQEVLRLWIGELSGEQPCLPETSTQAQETALVEANANVRFVIHELIYLLVRKKIITENEGAELLRGMLR